MQGPTLQEDEWELCIDMVSKADPRPDYIVGSGALPPGVPDDFYARLARVGHTLGARVIIDTPGNPLRLALENSITDSVRYGVAVCAAAVMSTDRVVQSRRYRTIVFKGNNVRILPFDSFVSGAEIIVQKDTAPGHCA